MSDNSQSLGLTNNTHDAAYEKGYNDYKRHKDHNPMSLLNPSYDPPTGCEESYKAGWERARHEQLLGHTVVPEGILDD